MSEDRFLNNIEELGTMVDANLKRISLIGYYAYGYDNHDKNFDISSFVNSNITPFGNGYTSSVAYGATSLCTREAKTR